MAGNKVAMIYLLVGLWPIVLLVLVLLAERFEAGLGSTTSAEPAAR